MPGASSRAGLPLRRGRRTIRAEGVGRAARVDGDPRAPRPVHRLRIEHLRSTLRHLGERLEIQLRQVARRLHDALHVETLEELEIAAHDGRLGRVPGIGPRRVAALRATLADALARVRDRGSAAEACSPQPTVAVLLDVDREYRTRARAASLPRIAPRRFNPTGAAHLPILHTTRGPWHLTALFSTTGRAHQLGKTHDWVIVYFAQGNHPERQCTIVTETRGTMAGRRVVRGREEECLSLLVPEASPDDRVLHRAS